MEILTRRILQSNLLLLGLLIAACAPEVPDESRSSDTNASDSSSSDSDSGSDDVVPPATLAFETVAIVSEENDDVVINPGETVNISIKIKNNKTNDVEDVTGVLSSDSDEILIFYPTGFTEMIFGDIPAGTTKCGEDSSSGSCGTFTSSYPRLDIGENVPHGNHLFIVNLTDSTGEAYQISFNIDIQPPSADLAPVSLVISSEENADSVVSPGETVRLVAKVKNIGSGGLLDVTGNLSIDDTGISIFNPTGFDALVFGDIAAGDSKCGEDSSSGSCGTFSSSYPRFDLGKTIVPGNKEITLDMTDRWGNLFSVTFGLNVQTPDGVFVFLGVDVASDTNDDGVANPGETVRIKIFVKNNGTAEILDLTGLLSTIVAGIGINYPSGLLAMDFGDVSPGETKCGEDSNSGSCTTFNSSYPSVEIPIEITPSLVPFTLLLTDKWDNTYSVSFDLNVE
ncbi:MAG: hypothetical protein IID61_08205 [SAR324 cluster bacterium]|nr:hypothetical protein [SAR324 cluster bacterium]